MHSIFRPVGQRNMRRQQDQCIGGFGLLMEQNIQRCQPLSRTQYFSRFPHLSWTPATHQDFI